ncbi:hypothetical protein OHV05_00050 [Kitasatospora sp. NBC_00070]|uniref:hypothetical protein n=1 Tax=Kitasatospora sp. NBC_00070 TaxID=2975962 RepID=UPI00324CA232
MSPAVANRESALSGDADQDVARLVGEFTDLRRGQPSGAARTYRQELIFAELARLTPRLPDFDVTASLASTEGGVRLAAYSRLYALPEEGFLPALVDAATAETLHFNQYWALQAISAVIDATGPGNVRLETVRRLRTYLPQLPHDSDRSAVLRAILGRLETRT